jgi:nuclear pore complex protein Nup93
LRNGNIDLALEYYAQAAAAMGGGEVSWMGEGQADKQRQRSLMLKQLLTEILLRDGGIQLLLGPNGMGEGELKKYMMDWRSRQQFLLEAAHRCQEAGLYDKVNLFC